MATLSRRTLNRTLLHRQGLLQPWNCTPLQVIQRLAGLQAQAPQAPYYGVLARLPDYDPAGLSRALTERKTVRLSLMRSTLQLVVAEDALAFRAVLAEQLIKILPKPLRESPVFTEVNEAARELIELEPRTFAELGPALHERFDQHRPDDLCRMARSGLALVQVPPRGIWDRSGPSRHAILQSWLGRELPDPDPAGFIERYLAAFGPATAADISAWSGLTGVGRILATMRLTRHRSEDGHDLFDLPDGELVDGDTEAPTTILAEFDNILLGHADRSRIFDDEHRMKFMSQNGLIASTLLVDGFVAGHCRLDRVNARITVQPYRRLRPADRRAAVVAAERVVAFSSPGQTGEVTVQPV